MNVKPAAEILAEVALARPQSRVRLDILRAVADLTAAEGFAPTLREVGERVGLSHNAVYYHVEILVGAQLLTARPNTARSLRVSPHGQRLLEWGTR